jgi:FixJ family two-component response regulator
MPEMSGTELAARIKEARPGVSVAYMSGYPERISTNGSPPVEGPFIQKPFDAETLAGVIEQALSQETVVI